MKYISYLSGPAYISILKGLALVAVMWAWASVMEMDRELEMSPLSAIGPPYAASDSRPDSALRVQAAQTTNERSRNEKQGKFAGQ